MTSNKAIRTRGKATDDAIRQLLIDYYVNNPVFKMVYEFFGSLNTFNDPEYNKRLYREFGNNPENTLPMGFFKNDNDTKIVNFGVYVLMYIILRLYNAIKNPLGKKKGDLTEDSGRSITYWFEHNKWPLKEVREKYNLSYPTLQNRLPLFFEIKTENIGRSHHKFLYPKISVFFSLARYYSERKIIKNGKNLYLEIIDLFKNIDI